MKTILAILFAITSTTICAFTEDNNEKLLIAIIKSDSTAVKELLKENADPNYIKVEGPWMKYNMLIAAIINSNIDIVKILIANKADVQWKDGFETSAILYAASKGDKEIVALLLENGADINDSDGNGKTVLSASKESKNKELIKFIEDKLQEKK